MQQFVGPAPHQLGAGLHAHIGHHAQVEGALVVQLAPGGEEGVIGIGQKGVVELICQPGFELFQAGKIHHKATVVEFIGPKPEAKTAAVTMHEAAVALVAPLAMATGITAEGFTAAVGRSGHG